MRDDVYVSWEEVENSVKHIRLYLQKIGKDKPEAIACVVRGGMVPALLLSHALRVEELLMVRARSYTQLNQQQTLKLFLPPKEDTVYFDANQGAGLLVIDDLVDTGTTFKALQQMWPKATYVCLLRKPEGSAFTHFAPMECPQDKWVYFPWE